MGFIGLLDVEGEIERRMDRAPNDFPNEVFCLEAPVGKGTGSINAGRHILRLFATRFGAGQDDLTATWPDKHSSRVTVGENRGGAGTRSKIL